MKGAYALAGIAFGIDSVHPYVHKLFADYPAEGEPAFWIGTSPEDIAAERDKSAREDIAEGRRVRSFPDQYLETLAVYRKVCEKLLGYGVILFHSSAIAVGGNGYLFAAPSGTGKSTHTRLWTERFCGEVSYINDDKPLIRVEEGRATVYGTPYGGKDNLCNNVSAPVGGIVILHRAEENAIKRLTPKEAFPALLDQTYRANGAENMFKTLELVGLLSKLPVYSMGCNISPEAAVLARRALTGEDI